MIRAPSKPGRDGGRSTRPPDRPVAAVRDWSSDEARLEMRALYEAAANANAWGPPVSLCCGATMMYVATTGRLEVSVALGATTLALYMSNMHGVQAF